MPARAVLDIRNLDVSFAEVVALEEQGMTGRFGKSIGEAIAEIKPGGMVAAPEAVMGRAGEFKMLNGNGAQFDTQFWIKPSSSPLIARRLSTK